MDPIHRNKQQLSQLRKIHDALKKDIVHFISNLRKQKCNFQSASFDCDFKEFQVLWEAAQMDLVHHVKFDGLKFKYYAAEVLYTALGELHFI